jgi:hypothetical protein
MPADMVRSRFRWLTYNEPEGHLDDLASRLAEAFPRHANILGLTYKDNSTLARLRRLGYERTVGLDQSRDLGIHEACAGLETIQAVFDPALSRKLKAVYGAADLLLVRHVLEHAHVPTVFLRALAELLAPDGVMVLEVPDCRKFIEACDYSFLWEEHITYFSPHTLGVLAQQCGFTVAETLVYPYPLEDSLVAFVKRDTVSRPDVRRPAASSLCAGRRFASAFNERCARWRTYLARESNSGARIAVFGAGHLATKFINFYGLRDMIECVIDDNSDKAGLHMPGSRLAIESSARLRDIDLCLLSLSPESEGKVIARNQAFLDGGGRFVSIFARSSLALDAP